LNRCRVLDIRRAVELADVVVQDSEGRDVRLGELWRDGPAVLVFVRHYG